MLNATNRNKIARLTKLKSQSKKKDKEIYQRMIDAIYISSCESKKMKYNSKPLDLVCSSPASNIIYATR